MNELLENAEVRDYHGFEHRVFELNGHEADVILPKEANGYWIWRAEFLGAFDTVDVEMVRRGYTLVYYAICDMYGSPEAVRLMKGFFDFCTEELGLYKKTVLFGFSRGGLYSANFALKYPDCVSVLYLDAPVLDLKSWPGGLGVGLGAERCFNECMEQLGLDRSTILAYRRNPVDRIGELIENRTPVALVAGDADLDVPLRENGAHLAEAYAETDVPLLYIVKPGCAHHPHSVEDPTAVADFIEKYSKE
ncbi:MAG: alpha/beta hydrolase [Clostridia bacterium]|nr:alpha/beta hydrolase [Clostridia bacterium]